MKRPATVARLHAHLALVDPTFEHLVQSHRGTLTIWSVIGVIVCRVVLLRVGLVIVRDLLNWLHELAQALVCPPLVLGLRVVTSIRRSGVVLVESIGG